MSQQQIKKRKAPVSDFPLEGDTLREQVLKAGNVTVKTLGRILSKGIIKTEKLLEADSLRVLTNRDGKVVGEVRTPHLDVQLRAAKQAIEVAGGFPTRATDGGKGTGGVVIHVHLPWQGKDKGQEVIEAQGKAIPAEKGSRAS